MKISLHQGVASDLPPAYLKLEKLSHAHVDLLKEWEEFKSLSPFSLDFDAALANENAVKKFQATFCSTFANIFAKEVKSGNFEIFEADGFLGLLLEVQQKQLLEDFPNGQPEVLSKLMALAEKEPSQAPSLAAGFNSHLDAFQIQRLWDLFKLHLDTNILDWNTDEVIKAKIRPESLPLPAKLKMVLGLSSFASSVNVPSPVLDEIMTLAWDDIKESAVRARIADPSNSKFTTPIDIKKYPRAFMRLQPEEFSLLVQNSGVDFAVVQVLLPGWDYDLETLLSAAASLSADK